MTAAQKALRRPSDDGGRQDKEGEGQGTIKPLPRMMVPENYNELQLTYCTTCSQIFISQNFIFLDIKFYILQNSHP